MTDFKTNEKKVHGLGSSHSGVHHWASQKFTAIVNIISVAWLLLTICNISAADYNDALDYLRKDINMVMALIFSVNVFYHAKLGLQVVIEDYIPKQCVRTFCLIAMNFLVYFGMATCIYALLKIISI